MERDARDGLLAKAAELNAGLTCEETLYQTAAFVFVCGAALIAWQYLAALRAWQRDPREVWRREWRDCAAFSTVIVCTHTL